MEQRFPLSSAVRVADNYALAPESVEDGLGGMGTSRPPSEQRYRTGRGTDTEECRSTRPHLRPSSRASGHLPSIAKSDGGNAAAAARDQVQQRVISELSRRLQKVAEEKMNQRLEAQAAAARLASYDNKKGSDIPEHLRNASLTDLMKMLPPSPVSYPPSTSLQPPPTQVAVAAPSEPSSPSERDPLSESEVDSISALYDFRVKAALAQLDKSMIAGSEEKEASTLVRITRLRGVPNYHRGIFPVFLKKGRSGHWIGKEDGDLVSSSSHHMMVGGAIHRWLSSFSAKDGQLVEASGEAAALGGDIGTAASPIKCKVLKWGDNGPISSSAAGHSRRSVTASWDEDVITPEAQELARSQHSRYMLTDFSSLLDSIDLLVQEKYGKGLTMDEKILARARMQQMRERKRMEEAALPYLRGKVDGVGLGRPQHSPLHLNEKWNPSTVVPKSPLPRRLSGSGSSILLPDGKRIPVGTRYQGPGIGFVDAENRPLIMTPTEEAALLEVLKMLPDQRVCAGEAALSQDNVDLLLNSLKDSRSTPSVLQGSLLQVDKIESSHRSLTSSGKGSVTSKKDLLLSQDTPLKSASSPTKKGKSGSSSPVKADTASGVRNSSLEDGGSTPKKRASTAEAAIINRSSTPSMGGTLTMHDVYEILHKNASKRVSVYRDGDDVSLYESGNLTHQLASQVGDGQRRSSKGASTSFLNGTGASSGRISSASSPALRSDATNVYKGSSKGGRRRRSGRRSTSSGRLLDGEASGESTLLDRGEGGEVTDGAYTRREEDMEEEDEEEAAEATGKGGSRRAGHRRTVVVEDDEDSTCKDVGSSLNTLLPGGSSEAPDSSSRGYEETAEGDTFSGRGSVHFSPDSTISSGRSLSKRRGLSESEENANLDLFLAHFPEQQTHVNRRKDANAVLSHLEALNTNGSYSYYDKKSGDTSLRGSRAESEESSTVDNEPLKGFFLEEGELRKRFRRDAEKENSALVEQRNRLRHDVERQKNTIRCFGKDIEYLSYGNGAETADEYAESLTREVNAYAKHHDLRLNQLADGNLSDANESMLRVAHSFLDQFGSKRVTTRSVASQVTEEDLGIVDESVRLAEEQLEDLMYHERALLDSIRLATIAVANVMSFHASLELESTCKECFFLFDHPRTLWPCGHTFCQRCLLRMYNARDEIICRECGSVCDIGYTPNLSVEVVAHYQVIHEEDDKKPIKKGKSLTIEGVLRRLLNDLLATQKNYRSTPVQ